jgi:hypothetical protein
LATALHAAKLTVRSPALLHAQRRTLCLRLPAAAVRQFPLGRTTRCSIAVPSWPPTRTWPSCCPLCGLPSSC